MVVYSILAVTHALAGAAWLGSMVYSLLVLQPRARAYFGNEGELEAFFVTISHGARGKVLLALGVIVVTGAGLMIERWPHSISVRWLALVVAKVVLFAAALSLFIYTSWRLWPARLFASAGDLPRLQRTFRQVGHTMITLALLSMALGVLLHTW